MCSNFKNEEKQAMKWFISLFYSIFILYDFLYNYIFPVYVIKSGTKHMGFMGLWFYIIMLLLLPVMYYLHKENKEFLIKCICFGTYISLTIIDDEGGVNMKIRKLEKVKTTGCWWCNWPW
ncbi:hypothetical protein [Bacillus sp. 3103sda1]|uniref:hypothetical protein n=1 Tax=Bacillus sp. 3103sda1 TaxID=2953808 RepID=UPI0035C88497